ncbi:Phospholipid phosphatase 5, partial [Armadillidium nasatum]
SFCSLGFLSLWLCGKLGIFKGIRSNGWKLVIAGLPLIIALIIALSRTCDYHHHWQDVMVGSLIGGFVAYLCYRQYYPRLSSPFCHLPYLLIPSLPHFRQNPNNFPPGFMPQINGRPETDNFDPESPIEELIKWI